VLFRSFLKSNFPIYHDNPEESALDRDSYMKMDNTIKLEDFTELIRYRRQTPKLSHEKLSQVIAAFNKYHTNNVIK
jgi:hypothetical protein